MLQRNLWNKLSTKVGRLTKVRGSKSQLARDFGVSRQLLNAWLSGAALPTAENTLQLLQWVEAQEAQSKQQKSNPERAQTRSGSMTQKRKSTTNEKPKSDRS